MEKVLSEKGKHVLRFEPGEDVTLNLLTFAMNNDIKAAWFSGIGSSREVELGYYDWPDKEYKKQVFHEEMEVISLVGNVGILEKGPVVHAHGSFGLPDYRVIGGHVHRLITNTTVEIYLEEMDGTLKRSYDEDTGLNLFNS